MSQPMECTRSAKQQLNHHHMLTVVEYCQSVIFRTFYAISMDMFILYMPELEIVNEFWQMDSCTLHIIDRYIYIWWSKVQYQSRTLNMMGSEVEIDNLPNTMAPCNANDDKPLLDLCRACTQMADQFQYCPVVVRTKTKRLIIPVANDNYRLSQLHDRKHRTHTHMYNNSHNSNNNK